MTIRVRAIRFHQNGRVFYATVVPAGELIRASKVDTWSSDVPGEDAGYQRAPSRARLRQVAQYVERPDAILPLGGLANARSQDGSAYGQVLHFDADPDQPAAAASGWLTLDEAALPLYVVDMQHRIGGIRTAIEEDNRSDLKEFPVLVTIADGLSKMEEIEQFEVINTTQKKVRTDLARRLMSIQAEDTERRLGLVSRGKLWEARGPIVTDWLNKEGVVWLGRIMPPNKTKGEMPRAIVRETSFVTSLKPVLQTPFFQRMAEDQVATVIDRYWQAVAQLWANAFEYPTDHVIQKTPGIFSLHEVMPEVVEQVRSEGEPLSVESFSDAIKPWSELTSDYWESGNEDGAAKYGSMKGFKRLAAELREMLPDLELDI